jgi:hypothetical protein
LRESTHEREDRKIPPFSFLEVPAGLTNPSCGGEALDSVVPLCHSKSKQTGHISVENYLKGEEP